MTAVPGRDYPEPALGWLAATRVRFVLTIVALAAFYSVSWHLAKVDVGKLATGLPRMASWVAKSWPPATDELPVLLRRAAETVAMAALGTTGAALLALPLCVLAARNVTPSMALYYPARWFLNMLRGIDSFVFALLFVAAVGLGPFAGVLGIALHTLGEHRQAVGGSHREHPAGTAGSRGGHGRLPDQGARLRIG